MSDNKRSAPRGDKGAKKKPSKPKRSPENVSGETMIQDPPRTEEARQTQAVAEDNLRNERSETNDDRTEQLVREARQEKARYQEEPREERRPPQRDFSRQTTASHPSDEYSIQVCFDKGNRQFVATVIEFPELKATGNSREEVLTEIQDKLEPHYTNLYRQGASMPEPIYSRTYPEKLEVFPSQSLFRKLDLMSRQQKVSLDQLVIELLSQATARGEGSRGGGEHRKPSQGGHQQQHHSPGNQRQGGGQRPNRHQGHRGGGRGPQGRNYHETMDNRENFLEYVRNLEKNKFNKR